VPVKLPLLEFSFVHALVGKHAPTTPVAHAVYPASRVGRSILVRHLALNHLAINVLAFEYTSVGELHDTVAVLMVILEATFIEIAVAIAEPALSGPSPVLPITCCVSWKASMGQTSSRAQKETMQGNNTRKLVGR